jgi:hypothetical protein
MDNLFHAKFAKRAESPSKDGTGLSGLAAGVAIDGAELVAGRAVLFLFCDGGEVGDVVGGGHGDGAHPEASEGGMAVEQGVVLGIDIEEVEVPGGPRVGILCEGPFDVAEEAAEDGQLEGVEEEGESGLGGNRVFGGVGVVQAEWG